MPESAYAFPADWDTKTIRDIACHVGSGATPTGGSAVYSKTGITFIRSQNVTFKGLLLDDVAFIESRIHRQMTRSEIFPHDVLLNITGASIGRCGFVPHDFGLANVNQHVCAIRLPKASHEDAVFLSGVLASHIGQSQIDRLNAGGNREGLNYQQVRSFLIPWPRPAERKRIAGILEAVDEAIAKTEAVIAKLKQVRAGLLHDLLTRGLDEHGQLRDPIAHPEQFQDSPLGWIPREWEVWTVGQLDLLIIDGDRGSNYPNESQLLEQGFCVFLNNKNIVDGSIDFSTAQFISEERDSLLGKGKLNPGDIVITTRGTVGNIALFSGMHPYWHVRINSGMIILRAYENAFVSQFFVMLWRFLFPSEYRRLSSGSAQPQFPIRDIQHFRLLVPKRLEQERIVSASSSVESALVQEQRTLDKLTRLKSGLMADLLTGRVRVPELEDGRHCG